MSNMIKAMDISTAAAHVASAMSDVAAIYPSPELFFGKSDYFDGKKKRNIFGKRLKVLKPSSQSEFSDSLNGHLESEPLTTTFTIPGLMPLIIPHMHKLSRKLQPALFHIMTPPFSNHGKPIPGDHHDVMAARHTGFAMLSSGSVQESMDLALVAHLSSIESQVPFIHFFDMDGRNKGQENIEPISIETIKSLVNIDAVNALRNLVTSQDQQKIETTDNFEIEFQIRETANKHYLATGDTVLRYMKKIGKIFRRNYRLFDYIGDPEAERVVVSMGSASQIIEKNIVNLAAKGKKVGLIKVRLYRPFVNDAFLSILPKSCRTLIILDQVKGPKAIGDPLFLDVNMACLSTESRPEIIAVRDFQYIDKLFCT